MEIPVGKSSLGNETFRRVLQESGIGEETDMPGEQGRTGFLSGLNVRGKIGVTATLTLLVAVVVGAFATSRMGTIHEGGKTFTTRR